MKSAVSADPVAVAADPRALDAAERVLTDLLAQRVEHERAAEVDAGLEQSSGSPLLGRATGPIAARYRSPSA